ncbi:uncharacterized protein BCR38DRAFT_411521 [Pseudomassariella vexata]|uniref:Uncharacterized protein n=1 Tax=Pseudomassariella vexata TaxID=1141098 RepID=A0A1Y2DQW0_9PEZI|nr:uncharacterized protein BCR38DRAFT_411521 [Pseudomassariella vexata]ORY61668.1 hypothetical protein BCR38DRAFT_411521 [Pseudomassariella vexata]
MDKERLEMANSFGMIPVHINDHKDVADYLLSVEPHGMGRPIDANSFRFPVSVAHKAMRAVRLEVDKSDSISVDTKTSRKRGNLILVSDFFFSTDNFPIDILMEKSITLRGGQLFYQKIRNALLLEFRRGANFEPSTS